MNLSHSTFSENWKKNIGTSLSDYGKYDRNKEV